MIKRKNLLFFLSVIMLTLAACAPKVDSTENAALSGTIGISGSTTVQPLAETLAMSFMSANPGVEIDMQGGGSSVGVKSAGQGTSDIGTASREVKSEEFTDFPDLVVTVIARDGIAIVVNGDVTVDSLSIEQVRGIFAGEITNWDEVGGLDQAIFVVSREESSGTRDTFQELVMGKDALIANTAILQPSNGAVRTAVATTPYAIAYLSFGYLDETVKKLSVDGVAPTEENVANGSYPVVRSLNMLTKGAPEGVVKSFLDFILSDAGQTIVKAEGYLPLK